MIYNMALWSCLARGPHTLLSTPATKGTSLLEYPRGLVSTLEYGVDRHLFANVWNSIHSSYDPYNTNLITAIYCPNYLPNPQYGSVKLSGYSPSHAAVYTCNKGYKLVGLSKRTCLYSGVWDGEAPICKRKRHYHSMIQNVSSHSFVQQSTVLTICLAHNMAPWSCLATVLHTLLSTLATKGTGL